MSCPSTETSAGSNNSCSLQESCNSATSWHRRRQALAAACMAESGLHTDNTLYYSGIPTAKSPAEVGKAVCYVPAYPSRSLQNVARHRPASYHLIVTLRTGLGTHHMSCGRGFD